MGRKSFLLEALLIVAIAITSIGAVALPLLGYGGLGVISSPVLNVEAELREPIVGPVDLGVGSYETGEAVELGGRPTVTATVFSPDWKQRLGLVGGEVLAGLAALAVLVLLLRITRTLRRGEVFAPANARRLQLIALVLAMGGMGSQLLSQFGRLAALGAETVRGLVVESSELSFLPLFAALLVAVLSEVFRLGTVLREDVRGLV